MDPQQAAHLIRIMRTIAVELRLANDVAVNTSHRYSTAYMDGELDERRDKYREEMS